MLLFILVWYCQEGFQVTLYLNYIITCNMNRKRISKLHENKNVPINNNYVMYA